MKAAVLKTLGKPLELTDLPDPSAGAGEAVIRVSATPVLSYMRDVCSGERRYPLLLPLAPGSGPVGVVEDVGPDATVLKPGQLVFANPTVRSRDSETPDIMLQGLIAPGPGAQRLQAHFRHGAFATRMLVPLENLAPLEGFDQDEAARLTWLSTLLVPHGGFLAAGLEPGQSVIVNGATGHFGSAGAAVALAMGAERVVAAGRKPEILELLREQLGPRIIPVALTGDESRDTKLLRDAAGGPVDCLLDMLSPLGTSAAVCAAIMALRPGGVAVLMGGVQADVSVPYSHIMRNSIVLRGQFMYPRQAPRLLAGLIRARVLNLAPFKVECFPLQQANAAIEYAAAHGGPFELTVIVPSIESPANHANSFNT